jgi:beta-glucosidase
MEVVYHRGCGVLPTPEDDLQGAVDIAREADVIVLALGDVVEQHGEFKDRADLALSGRQTELFQKLAELNIPIVTVMICSKPLCLGDVAEHSSALLMAFNGGMFGGQAVAETLFGELNPAGRLPISIPRHSGQLPVYYNSLPGWNGDKYVDLPATPLYAFGEGVGYSHFSYGNLYVEEETLTARVDVTNTGTRDGIETVQVYIRDCVSSVMRPDKQLVAFQRVSLAAGETKTVSIPIDRDELALVTPDEKRVVEPGEFILMAGHSSRDKDLLHVAFRFAQ